MIEEFNEVYNTICIAKRLYDLGEYNLVAGIFTDVSDRDSYNSDMYELMSNLFQYHYCRYYEYRGFELHIFSDPVIVDFCILAGEYGRSKNIPDKDNPYIIVAKQVVYSNLDISHELDWVFKAHTNPQRPFHSRLALSISNCCGCLDLGVLVYRLIEIYQWFTDKCAELRGLLDRTMGGLQISLSDMEVVA